MTPMIYVFRSQVVFEAVRGSSFRADMGLDDISFKESPCCKQMHF